MKVNLSAIILFLYSFSLNAQNVGGFDAGQITPQAAKPYDLKAGVISGNVNLFDGSYNYTQPLASISTPSGLSYDVQISYNSTNQTGNNPSNLSGVPYGDGWNIAIPNIRISTGSYSKYGDCGVDFGANTNPTAHFNRAEALKEGQLYWMAPVLNIPGIVSGRLVYKYSDNNGPIFVLNEFEKYIEARFSGEYWEVKLWDGTVWSFKHQQVSYRNASDQRVDTEITGKDGVLQNLTIPKIEAAVFYATSVTNPNHPAGNSIQFEYEVFGTFNFHKEHLQPNIIYGYKFLDLVWVDTVQTHNYIINAVGDTTGVNTTIVQVENWALPNSSLTNSVPQFTGFNASRDFFLKGIYSFSTADMIYEKIDFDYKTYEFSNGVNLPKISDPGVQRYDSLYNISSVYKVNNANSGFSGWNRYRHWRSNEVVSDISITNGGSYNVPTMNRDNPYVGQSQFASSQRLYEKPVSSSVNGIPFDHSFLESPKIMGGVNYGNSDYIVPGELYELKTKIRNNNTGYDRFCNFDVNLTTGLETPNSLNDNFAGKNFYDYTQERTQTIFSTFNRSIKWNNIEHGVQGTSLMTTSNLFTMPNIPMEDFHGFFIQVGPGNSDQIFDADHAGNPSTNYLDIYQDQNSGHSFLYGESTYYNEYPNLTDNTLNDNFRTGNPIKNNFGIGYPWHMAKAIYERSISVIDDNDKKNLYSKWWNYAQDTLSGWKNEPTRANEKVLLDEVELLRYSKNTYLLNKVQHYKINGEFIKSGSEIIGEGFRLVSEFEFDYTLSTSETYRDFSTEFSPCNFHAVSGKRNIINLKSIIQNPIKNIENLNPVYTFFEYDTIQNPFQPYTTQIIKENGIVKTATIGTSTMGTAHLNVLKKITNKLGGVTQIKYYNFTDPNTTYEYTTSDKVDRSTCSVSAGSSSNFRPSNNSAFSLKPAVKQVIIKENGYDNVWDYEYLDKERKGYSSYWRIFNTNLNGIIGLGQTGFTVTKVYEPYLDPNNPSKRAYTIHRHYTDSISNWHLYGKLRDTKQYDANNNLLAESESIYDFKQAYKNGKQRNFDKTTPDYADYLYGSNQGFTNALNDNKLKMYAGINPILFSESQSLSEIEGLSNRFLNSYFVYKVRDINTYYEYTLPPVTNNVYQAVQLIDEMLLNFLTVEGMVDFTRAIDSNQLDSNDIISIYEFSKVLQKAYLRYDQDSLELSWVKRARNQKDEYRSIKVPFPDRKMAAIVDGDLASSIYLKLSDPVKQELFLAYAEDELLLMNNVSNYTNQGLADTLKIDLITDYEYWDANFDGTTNSNGFEILVQQNSFNNTNGNIQLFNEPSWQLFSKTTYSPQQPETFNREEYYYFFDLQNTWIGKNNNYNSKHIQYKICKDFGIRNLVYEVDNIQKTLNTKPIIKYNYLHYWDEWTTKPPYPDLPSLNATLFSSADTSTIPDILMQAGYFNEEIIELQTNNYTDSTNNYNDSITSFINYNIYEAHGCISLPKDVEMGWAPIAPPNGFYYYANDEAGQWYCPDSVRYLFSMPSDPYIHLNLGQNLTLNYVPNINFIEVKNLDDNIYYQINQVDLVNTVSNAIHYQDSAASISGTSYSNKSISLPQDTLEDYLPYWLLNLGKLNLKAAFINIDTLDLYPLFNIDLTDPDAYANSQVNSLDLPVNYHPITRWKSAIADRVNSPWPVPILNPIYPYAIKRLFEIEERNNFAQPSLVTDEKGLLSRYDFVEQYERKYFRDTLKNELFESSVYHNFALPTAITIGVGLPDSLLSTYDYSDVKNIASITDANGMTASYTYDDFARLKSSYLNGNKLDLNVYNYWDGDQSLSYAEKALQNYSEKYIFFDNSYSLGNKIRNYIDPTGKDYGSLSQSFNANPMDWHENILFSGQIVLDKWGRAIKSYKAFETTVPDTTFRTVPILNTDSSYYPQEYLQSAYEPNQRSRPLKTADFGEALLNNTHIIQNEYKLVKGLQAAVELELSAYESDLLFGAAINDFVLKRTKTIDQDGKINFEYTDAFDRKIALKQVLDKNKFLITLFVYDAQGNVAKVINPKKQESNYEYNLEALLYRKTTPDEGEVKFRYNKAKQAVLQQDANFSSSHWSENKFRAYKYDAFGKLLEQYTFGVDPNLDIQDRATSSSSGIYSTTIDKAMDLPLFYKDLSFTSNAILPFSYINTYDDVEEYKIEPFFGLQAGYGSYYTHETIKNHFDIKDSSSIKLEKRFEYNAVDTTDRSIHLNARLFIVNSSENLRGKIARSIAYNNEGYPVQYSFFSYNDNGTLKWEMKQFNANGIQKENHGLMYRIDYKDYDYQGNLLTKNIDINSDFKLDAQYHYAYDEWNRLSETYFNMDNSKAAGNKIASFHYDNASGKILKTNYYKKDGLQTIVVDSINYAYDQRERLTAINSNLFDWAMYYDGNNLANVNNTNNYNGNINATKATYKMAGYTALQGMFDAPTNYGYQYDNINRLVKADAHYNATQPQTGDVDYTYDVIGNLMQLNRFVPGIAAAEAFTYQYALNSNRLLAVNSSIATNNRDYTYDANGNLLTDSYKKLSGTKYGRANLPVALSLENGEGIDYLFDEADDRMYKNHTDTLGVSQTKEYYIKDASGKTLSVYDFNKDELEWYIFGANRTAKTKPSAGQQPHLSSTTDDAGADGSLKNAMIADEKLSERSVQLKATLLEFETKNYGFPDELLLVRYADNSEEIILAKNFDDKIAQNPNLVYDKVFTTYIENDKQSISLEKDLLNFANLDAETNRREGITMTIKELFAIQMDSIKIKNVDTTSKLFCLHSLVLPTYDPFTDSAYTLLNDKQVHNLTFYVYDHLGNTRVTYQPSVFAGNVSYSIKGVFDYYPYGKTLRQYNIADEKYLTTQHERDAETGFDYRGARFYDSDVARFLSVDPLAKDFPNESSYFYVGGNPTSFIDPDGKAKTIYVTIINADGSKTYYTAVDENHIACSRRSINTVFTLGLIGVMVYDVVQHVTIDKSKNPKGIRTDGQPIYTNLRSMNTKEFIKRRSNMAGNWGSGFMFTSSNGQGGQSDGEKVPLKNLSGIYNIDELMEAIAIIDAGIKSRVPPKIKSPGETTTSEEVKSIGEIIEKVQESGESDSTDIIEESGETINGKDVMQKSRKANDGSGGRIIENYDPRK